MSLHSAVASRDASTAAGWLRGAAIYMVDSAAVQGGPYRAMKPVNDNAPGVHVARDGLDYEQLQPARIGLERQTAPSARASCWK